MTQTLRHPALIVSFLLCCVSDVQSDDRFFTGYVVDAATGLPINKLSVHAYEIDNDFRTRSHIGTKQTNDEGFYEIKIPENVPRIQLSFRKGDETTQNLYGPEFLLPLSGHFPGELNVALDPSSGDSAARKRRRVGNVGRAVREERRWNPLFDTSWAAAYVGNVVRGYQNDRTLDIGEELMATISAFRTPDSKGFATQTTSAIAGNQLYLLDVDNNLGNISLWDIPERIAKPSDLTGQFRLNIPWSPRQDVAHRSIKLLPAMGQMKVLCSTETPNRRRTQIAFVSPESPNLDWSAGNAEELIGSTSGPKDTWSIDGDLDGRVTVTYEPEHKKSEPLKVSTLPIGATAISSDRKLFAAAAIDGSFKVWKLKSEKDPASLAPLRQGRLPRMFPASAAISTALEILIVGTGLESSDNAIIGVDLRDTQRDPAVLGVPSSLTQLDFVEQSIVAMDVAGNTSILSIERDNGSIQFKKKFVLQGIQSVTISPDLGAAVVVPSTNRGPAAFPLQEFLKQESFDEGPFGIAIREK